VVCRALHPDFIESVNNIVSPVLEQVSRARSGRDADDEPETSGASRFDASRRILENCGTDWRNLETACGFQEHVWSRFTYQTELVEIDSVDTRVEQRGQTASAQDFRTVMAGRGYGRTQAARASFLKKGHGGV
jgi:hypothetical protein